MMESKPICFYNKKTSCCCFVDLSAHPDKPVEEVKHSVRKYHNTVKMTHLTKLSVDVKAIWQNLRVLYGRDLKF